MKQKLFIVLVFISFIFMVKVDALELDIQSENAYFLNLDDNEVLYTKDADEKVEIASLTKIMTAIVTLENIENLDEKVTLIDDDFAGLIEENLVTAGFKAGQTVTYRDLLYGLLLPSGADAAKALTRLVGTSEDNFIQMMNDKAKELKLQSTHFSNAVGLDDENNYSTATDVAQMFKYALDNADFREIITTKSYKTSNGLLMRSTVNNNSLVSEYEKKKKTGTTDGAGLCLASLASFDDSEFLLVTLGAPYDKKGMHNIEDAYTVYNYFDENYDYQTVVNKDEVIWSLDTKYLTLDKIDFHSAEDMMAYLPNNYNKEDLTYKYDGIDTVSYQDKKGDKLGTLAIYYDDMNIGNIPIILETDVTFDVFAYILDHKEIVLCVLLGIILIILGFKFRKRRKKKRKRK